MREHRFHTPLPLTLDVSVPSGEIEVETVDGEESTIEVEGDETLLEHLEVQQNGDRVTVALRGRAKLGISISIGTFVFGNGGLGVRARIPHGASLKVKTASADVNSHGSLRSLELNAVSGDLRLRGDIAETARIKTVSGDVGLDRVGGDLTVESISGDVRVGDVGGNAELKSISGDMRLGALAAGDVRFNSVSGDVEIGIAPGSLLDVDAGSTSGDLSSEVALADVPGGEMGDGPTVVLRGRTISGDVNVFRAA
jgi:hypothetical protein